MTARLLRFAGRDKVPLAQNAAHRFAAQQALVCYRTDTVYSFIPKNGCSSLRLSLAMANGCIAGPEDWTWIHPNNTTFAASLRELVTARFTFVVLRCPFARLASLFLDKIVSRQPEYWTLFRLEGDRLTPDTLTFRGFVGLLGKPGRLKANIHWRPQSNFLVYAEYDGWYALEDFATAIREIEERAGFPVHDARPLTQHGTDRFTLLEGDGYADTPLSEIERMQQQGQSPSHAALYDAALVAAVARLYAGDIALYRNRFGASGLTFPE
jgi:hypothetical protein